MPFFIRDGNEMKREMRLIKVKDLSELNEVLNPENQSPLDIMERFKVDIVKKLKVKKEDFDTILDYM
jgi:hypothetical protein